MLLLTLHIILHAILPREAATGHWSYDHREVPEGLPTAAVQ